MANSLNLCIFTGNLGDAPEIRYSQSGDPIATFSLAISGRKKNGDQYEDETQWARCVAFKGHAKVMQDYTQKGSKIRITTKYTNRKWQDQNGQDRYTVEFVVNDLELLDRKPEGAQPRQQAQQQQRPQYAGSQQTRQPEPEPQPAFEDSDIPF